MAKDLALFSDPVTGFAVPKVCAPDIKNGECKNKQGAVLVSCLIEQKSTLGSACRTAIDYLQPGLTSVLQANGWYLIPKECNRDRINLCPGIKPNQEIAACLLDKKADVKNAKCAATLDAAKVSWDILIKCESSIRELCPNSAGNGVQATNCIMSMQDGVKDASCSAAIKALKDIQMAAENERIKCKLTNTNNCQVESVQLLNYSNGVSITMPAR
jgi:hypothetical protein